MSPLRLFWRAAVILIVTNLIACGFHLRGFGESSGIAQPAMVAANAHSEIADALRLVLSDSDISLTGQSSKAAIAINIIDEGFDSRTLSIGSDTRIRDIELRYYVRYTLQRRGDAKPATDQLSATREYTFDSSGVLGSSDEEAVLFEEMQSEIVQRILARLVAASAEINK